MAWMETDYSKHTHFRWKIKWRLEHLGTLGIMGETVPSLLKTTFVAISEDFLPSTGSYCLIRYYHNIWNPCNWSQS